LAPRLIDRNLYRDRNKIERFFSRLKQFRRLATRYDKTASSFLGMVHFISAILWLQQLFVRPSTAQEGVVAVAELH